MGKSDTDIEPSTMSLMIAAVSQAKDLAEISALQLLQNELHTYEVIHRGICKIDGIPVKDTIHCSPISGTRYSVSDLDEDLIWAICLEAEYLLRPFDLLTHSFKISKTPKVNDFRKKAAQLELKQIIIIPFRIKNTILITTINFPDGDFDKHMFKILPQFYQVSLALLDRFPRLLTWTESHKLTLRETEILSLSAHGLTEAIIAEKCGISINTVRNHVENCKVKLNARNKLHAVMIATENHDLKPAHTT